MADEDGRKRLKDLAQGVRDKVQTDGRLQLDRKGTATLEQIVADLTGPEGMPGLYTHRDTPTKVRLRRQGKAGQIIVEWHKPLGAMEVTFEKFNARVRQSRYLLNEAADTWHPMEGTGELFADLSAALVDILYPEGNR